jgi:hypothetical protein
MKKSARLVAVFVALFVALFVARDARAQRGLDVIPADIQGILTVNRL